ncbi:ABC transporter substrate-binding protein [Paracoccus seriniphilus]|uniref:Osmoprotectant transport system substrate-binding protein n=1 Tax=Paracoccus seriniphilus TaxID=184748 RepID=A0A239Q339_9RHOB|nr:ABC transporter substrate-binding protein [Paracoccus seriniphilus]WCR15947.1 ABC transporter substrate-binding protein [Paracoccus seriniphilus]SNT76686.1 osmoprotectant transport system substrate-binding protein [Paracoccus seriniphilus]
MKFRKYMSLVVAGLALGSGMASAQVVVSSKIDTEGGILGTMIVKALNAGGIETENRLQLGGTPILREAITAGEIDIYPEYTGNAAFFFNEAESPVWKDPEASYARAAELDLSANDIVWLPPAPANNTWAIALRGDVAGEHDLVSMSDLGAFIESGGEVKLAASAEFVNSAAALPSFQDTYEFELSSDQLVILSGGDTAATIAAAARGTSGVNAAMVYGTDGGISPSGLVVMEDDKNVQPLYQPAPLVRGEVLEAHPEIAELLAPVFSRLDLETLQELNARVQINGEPTDAVVSDFMSSAGLLD